jgi:hypothetical protein
MNCEANSVLRRHLHRVPVLLRRRSLLSLRLAARNDILSFSSNQQHLIADFEHPEESAHHR